ncbi:hypothetical protein GCM10009850_084350 [Nonomuraea monospora]|uniref:Uncharacterized protein n=1 Tax=Nonomuraea monospora TaxID=568818 RepID=A0ABN3CUJ7_9ACTN
MLPAGHADGCADEGAERVGAVVVPGGEAFGAGQDELAAGGVAFAGYGWCGLVDGGAGGWPGGFDGVLDEVLWDLAGYPQADRHAAGAEAVLEAEARLAESRVFTAPSAVRGRSSHRVDLD